MWKVEKGSVLCVELVDGPQTGDRGLPKDLNEAVRLYRLASDQGLMYAQYNLACCFKVRTVEA